ncbi:MAG TPA: sugar phosphate isomerase/epimerase [Planctomycetota bacterium]|nr:sugar phosphate isomerase/epimerase [Planctomycetota bacterium]
MGLGDEGRVSRRDLLRLGAAGAAAALAGCVGRTQKVVATPLPPPAPLPFSVDIGLQSYSLRNFKFDDVVAKMKEAGIHFVEFTPGHFPMGMKPEELQAAQAKLAAAEIKANAYGVCGFSKDEAGIRRMFDFAKKAGFDCYTANPAPDAFDLLDKLCDEYDVKVAIHNHGPGDKRWGRTQQLLDGTKDRHKNIGVCLDAGHLIRAGDDLLDAVHKLGPRVLAFHFKDVNEQNHDVVVGKGKIDLVAFFTALKAVKFAGPFSLEYEIDAQNPMPGIMASVAALREALAKAS